MNNKTDNDISTTERDDTRLLYTLGEALGDLPSDEETQAAWTAFEARHNRLNRRRRALKTAITAIATAAVIAAAVFLLPWERLRGDQYGTGNFIAANLPESVKHTDRGQTTTISTPTATTVGIVLPDSTHVLLGPGSRIEYDVDFNKKRKRVVKLEGMAHFDVHHDSGRPFIVDADGVKTEVLGTVFDVRAYRSIKRVVTLYSGKVRVGSGNGGTTVTLTPGQKATFDSQHSVSVTQADLEASAGWTHGMFIFDDEKLEDVMNDIGSWYNVSISFTDRRTASIRVHFSFPRSASLPDVLRALNDMGMAHFKLSVNKVIVTR